MSAHPSTCEWSGGGGGAALRCAAGGACACSLSTLHAPLVAAPLLAARGCTGSTHSAPGRRHAAPGRPAPLNGVGWLHTARARTPPPPPPARPGGPLAAQGPLAGAPPAGAGPLVTPTGATWQQALPAVQLSNRQLGDCRSVAYRTPRVERHKLLLGWPGPRRAQGPLQLRRCKLHAASSAVVSACPQLTPSSCDAETAGLPSTPAARSRQWA